MKEKMTLKKRSISTEKTRAFWTQFRRKLFLASCLCSAVATGLLYWGTGLDAETWGMIAMTYIGSKPQSTLQKYGKG